MEKRRFLSVFILIFAVFSGIAAQESNVLPHVTQIKVEPRNNLIRITWVDSPDARGPVYIFRSTRPFTGPVPANIRPIVARYGDQYYIDDTDDIENLYYFIAASDISGRRYDVILPQVNATGINSSGEPVQQQTAPPLVVTPLPEPEQGISNLRAALEGERVIITFDILGPRRSAVLYRSMQPITLPQDLLNAVIVQSEIVSPFIDFPVPGITWYYAAIYEDDIAGGNMGIKPGINATDSAVLIQGDQSIQRELRPIPLPAMTVRSTMPDSFFLSGVTEQIPLGEAAGNMLRDIQIPEKEPLALKNPRVFALDMLSPLTGEESALFQILSEFFGKRDWEGARAGLQHYLSLPRSEDVEARARFYLGQTLYFTKNYREALFEFLSIRSIHTVEANIWIDAILAAMVH
ncbi:MAG: hypothetical protein FWC03_06875 [Treponema sp.]|nr:hypothetical protein [Treponema sp.]